MKILSEVIENKLSRFTKSTMTIWGHGGKGGGGVTYIIHNRDDKIQWLHINYLDLIYWRLLTY